MCCNINTTMSYFVLLNYIRCCQQYKTFTHIKCLLLLSDFRQTWVSSTDFHEIIHYKISRKSDQWQCNCSMRTGGRVDMAKVTVTFRNSMNAPKTCTCKPIWMKFSLHIIKSGLVKWAERVAWLAHFRAFTPNFTCILRKQTSLRILT